MSYSFILLLQKGISFFDLFVWSPKTKEEEKNPGNIPEFVFLLQFWPLLNCRADIKNKLTIFKNPKIRIRLIQCKKCPTLTCLDRALLQPILLLKSGTESQKYISGPLLAGPTILGWCCLYTRPLNQLWFVKSFLGGFLLSIPPRVYGPILQDKIRCRSKSSIRSRNSRRRNDGVIWSAGGEQYYGHH